MAILVGIVFCSGSQLLLMMCVGAQFVLETPSLEVSGTEAPDI